MHTVYLNESLFQNNDAVFTRKTLVYLAVLLLFVHIVWRRTEQFTASIFIFVQVVLYEEEKKIYTFIFYGCKSSWYILSVFIVVFFFSLYSTSLSIILPAHHLPQVCNRTPRGHRQKVPGFLSVWSKNQCYGVCKPEPCFAVTDFKNIMIYHARIPKYKLWEPWWSSTWSSPGRLRLRVLSRQGAPNPAKSKKRLQKLSYK